MTQDEFLTDCMKVQLLASGAMLPHCAHPGKDLGYDLFCAYETSLYPGRPTKVRTGIAVELKGHGFLLRDRSSLASRGITISGGVIDEGYTGEIIVIMTLSAGLVSPEYMHVGDKIAQMIPVKPNTIHIIRPVESLSESTRGNKGFGSTGQ